MYLNEKLYQCRYQCYSTYCNRCCIGRFGSFQINYSCQIVIFSQAFLTFFHKSFFQCSAAFLQFSDFLCLLCIYLLHISNLLSLFLCLTLQGSNLIILFRIVFG